jgi:hypothetical protein
MKHLLLTSLLFLTGCGASTAPNGCPTDIITSYHDINVYLAYQDVNGIMELNFNEYNSYFDKDTNTFRGWYYQLDNEMSKEYGVEFIMVKDTKDMDADPDFIKTFPFVKETQAYGYDQKIETLKIDGLDASSRTTYFGIEPYRRPYYYEIALIKDNSYYLIVFSDSDDFDISADNIKNTQELFSLFIKRIEVCKNKIE